MKAWCAVIALVACCAAWANEPSWVHIVDGDPGRLLVNPSTIARRGEYLQAWFMWDLINERAVADTSPEIKYRSLKQLNVFDCNLRQNAVIHGVFYFGASGQGEALETVVIDVKSAQFRDVVPDSVGEKMLRYVCDRDPRR